MILLAQAVEGEVPGLPAGVERLITGIGPIEAALRVADALRRAEYALVLNVGIAGGFDGAAVGAAVVVERECYVDLGREDGGALGLPPGVALIEETAADARLLERLRARLAADVALFGEGITSGVVTTSDARAAGLRARRPGALIESMEGFAVLRAAAAAGVPALELRGVSNRVGDRARAGWDFRAGAEAAGRLLAATLAALR